MPEEQSEESWPFADVVVFFNLTIDGLAMVPQLHLIAYTDEDVARDSPHIVGLFCVGRVFRMFFPFF